MTITKKYSRLSTLFLLLSITSILLPVITYTIIAFANGEVHEKVTLGLSLIVAFLLAAINAVFKYHIRSCIWIVLLGIYYCLDKIMPLLLLVAVATILDEFVFTPAHKHFKNKAVINKEIDKRL